VRLSESGGKLFEMHAAHCVLTVVLGTQSRHKLLSHPSINHFTRTMEHVARVAQSFSWRTLSHSAPQGRFE
jgi:hypothetical protein